MAKQETASELELSKQLIARLQKEIQIYKEFLTKTSSTEAKNTESLMQLTERNKQLTTDNKQLEKRNVELTTQLTTVSQAGKAAAISKTKTDKTIKETESRLASVSGELEIERRARIRLEKELEHMGQRLKQQAQAECDAAAVQVKGFGTF